MTDTLGPDELSELAECLEDACREAEERQWRITPDPGVNTCCPMGALVRFRDEYVASYPDAETIDRLTRIPKSFAYAFVRGFDGLPDRGVGGTVRGFEMGQSFRRRYVETEASDG